MLTCEHSAAHYTYSIQALKPLLNTLLAASMFQFKRENGRKILIKHDGLFPFVCKYDPFILSLKPHILPLVRRNTPNIILSGFTLIELMVTLVVVAGLVAIAIPSMRTITQNNRIMTQANDVLSDVNLARSEAVKRAVNVVICTWNSTTTPTAPSCNGGGNWSTGRIIWADTNNSGLLDVGELIRSREGGAAMTLTPFLAIDPVSFNSRGLPVTGAVNFRLCDYRGASSAKLIRITATGQSLVSTTPVTSCP